jgi:hypothetical protein
MGGAVTGGLAISAGIGVAVTLFSEEPLEAVGVEVMPTSALLSGAFMEQACSNRDMATTVSAKELRRVCFFICTSKMVERLEEWYRFRDGNSRPLMT